MSARLVRPAREGRVETRDRGLEARAVIVDDAAVVQGIDIIRRKLECPRVGRQRSIELPE
jgi:hypothetical protein